MAKCKNCKRLKYKEDGRERFAWCPLIGDCPDLEFDRYCGAFKKQTNADRIRNMTDEELAEHFSNFVKEAQSVVFCEDVSDWLKWLKSEVGCE